MQREYEIKFCRGGEAFERLELTNAVCVEHGENENGDEELSPVMDVIQVEGEEVNTHMMSNVGSLEGAEETSPMMGINSENGAGDITPAIRDSFVDGGGRDLEPYEGMHFKSPDDAHQFYTEYAKRVGFSTCIKFSWRSKFDRSFIGVEFGCSRHGFKKVSKNTKRPRPNLKTNCKASLKVKRAAIGKWVIVRAINEHNHELSPAGANLMQTPMSVVDNFNSSDESLMKMQKDKVVRKKIKLEKRRKFTYFEDGQKGLLGGRDEQIGNGNHLCMETRRELLGVIDAKLAHEHFRRMLSMNPTFFFSMEKDDDTSPGCIFWIDGKCRMDYTRFGDVIKLDTMCLINKYRIPFVSFVGINHHGQSLLFGCSLIREETVESFLWLFRTWLTSMYGRPPIAIMSDDDKAIKTAVSEVFPGACHRFCIEHILQKVNKKLACLCKENHTFLLDFKDCIYKSFEAAEFEEKWHNMIEKFDLGQDELLVSLYEDRQQWVPLYINDTLFAGMWSSLQGECSKSFFESCLRRETSFKEFLNQYLLVLQISSEKEVQADLETTHGPLLLKTTSPFESQMAHIYTSEIFKKFQVEITGIPGCFTFNFQQVWDTMIYTVRDLHAKLDYRVTWSQPKVSTTCQCRMWESQGYLCRHIMLVLLMSGVQEIPSHYISNRWTIEGRNRVQLGREHLESKLQRFNDLCQRFMKMAEDGCVPGEYYDSAIATMDDLLKKVAERNSPVGTLANRNNT